MFVKAKQVNRYLRNTATLLSITTILLTPLLTLLSTPKPVSAASTVTGYGYTKTMGGTDREETYGVVTDPSGNVYIAGGFYSATMDFDPGAGVDTHTSDGNRDIFLTKFTATYYQHINNLPAGLSASTIAGTSVDDQLVDMGILRGNTTTIRLADNTNSPLADVEVNFSTDVDWGTVTAGSSTTDFKSFVHNLLSNQESTTFSLYVPYREGDNSVIVCPGATSLSAVTLTCTNKVIYKLPNSNLSIVTINSTKYWKIDGLTGTGGMSTNITDPATGELADTGQNINLYLIISLLLISSSAYMLRIRNKFE